MHVSAVPEECFIIENSADTDEIMPHYAEFHLDLHCLQKYMYTGIQNEKG